MNAVRDDHPDVFVGLIASQLKRTYGLEGAVRVVEDAMQLFLTVEFEPDDLPFDAANESYCINIERRDVIKERDLESITGRVAGALADRISERAHDWIIGEWAAMREEAEAKAKSAQNRKLGLAVLFGIFLGAATMAPVVFW